MKVESPKYDAALLHVYGYKEKTGSRGKDRVRPAAYSRLVLAAARELKKAGQVDDFVLSGKQFLGKQEPVSTVTAQEFIRRDKVDSEKVYVNSSAPVTTNQELKFLRKNAEEQSWSRLVSIGWELHKPTIKTLSEKIFGERKFPGFSRKKIDITFLSTEEVLLDSNNTLSDRNRERYRRVIDSLHNSEGEKKWIKYEQRKKKILNLPFVPEILDVVARFKRPKAD